MENYNILMNKEKINVKLVDMKDKKVIAPFFLACSHYNNEVTQYLHCNKFKLKTDERVCCSCNFYDGGKVIGLKWDDKNKLINFMIYPYKTQYSLSMIKSIIKVKGLEDL